MHRSLIKGRQFAVIKARIKIALECAIEFCQKQLFYHIPPIFVATWINDHLHFTLLRIGTAFYPLWSVHHCHDYLYQITANQNTAQVIIWLFNVWSQKYDILTIDTLDVWYLYVYYLKYLFRWYYFPGWHTMGKTALPTQLERWSK